MLRIKATGQVLSRLDTLGIVADSINYLYAHFDLPSDYKGIITAHFKVNVDGVESDAPITLDAQNNCLVPSNVIIEPGFSIAVSSIDGGIYIVTDELTVDVASCGVPSALLPVPGETVNQYAELATALSTCIASASNSLISENNAKSSETLAIETASAIVEDEQARQNNELIRQGYYNAYKECNPYNGSTSYILGNKVTYNGSTYQCKANCVGVFPTNIVSWILIAQRGADGIGAGDMLASVYDTAGIEADIFDYADTKIAKSDIIQNDTTNDSTKFSSSAVTYQHGLEIDTNKTAIATINTNMAYEKILLNALTTSYLQNPENCYVKIKSGVKALKLYSQSPVNLLANTQYALFTLPIKYRPEDNVDNYIIIKSGVAYNYAMLTIAKTGVVSIYPYSAITANSEYIVKTEMYI